MISLAVFTVFLAKSALSFQFNMHKYANHHSLLVPLVTQESRSTVSVASQGLSFFGERVKVH